MDFETQKENFRKLCRSHDFWYMMSDDHSVWKAGMKSHSEITLGICQDKNTTEEQNELIRIFNSVVDEKMTDQKLRDRFYITEYRV